MKRHSLAHSNLLLKLFSVIVSLSLISSSFAGPVQAGPIAAPPAQATDIVGTPAVAATDTETSTATDTPASSDTPAATSTDTPNPTDTLTPTATDTATPASTESATPTTTVALETSTAGPISDTSVSVSVAKTGGVLTSPDNIVKIEFPVGALAKDITATYKHLSPGTQPGDQKMIFMFEATAQTAPGAKVTKFAEPLDFTIDLSFLGLKARPGFDGRTLWFGYFNETTKQWEPIPFTLDNTNDSIQIKARADHFSNFGVSATGNPGWALLYNEPQVNTFSGAGTYSYPITLPSGANGLQPPLSLAYNNQQVSGLHGWYQSDWVGHGWSLNTIEIVRELNDTTTTNSGAGCTNNFTLLFNGTGYNLLAANGNATALGQYYTQQKSDLYIERVSGGEYQGSDWDSVHYYNNTTREYWIIKDGNGTVYRLGWKGLAEQIVRSANQGSCASTEIKSLRVKNESNGADDGTTRPHFAFRWRLDQITDVYGNVVDLHYGESRYRICIPGDPNPNNGWDDLFSDRENVLSSISYNNVSVSFNVAARPTGSPSDDGYGSCGKLFFQGNYLSSITVSLNAKALRLYSFGYDTSLDTERTPGGNLLSLNGTASRRLVSIQESGYDENGVSATALPATTFSYLEYKNFDAHCLAGVNCPPPNNSCGGNPYDCIEYHYWHLWRAHNGYGTIAEFYYESDGRTAFWFYDGGHTYRVTLKTIGAGASVNAVPAGANYHPLLQWQYSYTQPCYNQTITSGDALGTGGTICPSPAPTSPSGVGRLVGHEIVTAIFRLNGTHINTTVYTFENDNLTPDIYQLGRELSRVIKTPANVTLSSTTSTYTTTTQALGSYTMWLTTLTNASGTVDSVTTTTSYLYDTYGHPTEIYKKGTGTASDGDEQIVRRGYLNDASTPATKWFVGKVITETVSSASTLLADTRYFYDGQLPYSGTCAINNNGCTLNTATQTLGTKGAPTGKANWINGTSWAVGETGYDAIGNAASTTDPRRHVVTTAYTDTRFPYLPTGTTNELGHTTSMTYNRRGWVISLTDPNNQTINYEYDNPGRLTKVYEPLNPTAFPALEYQYTDNYNVGGLLGLKVVTKVRETSSGTSTLDTYTFYNGMGQVVQVRSPMPSNQQSVANTVYGANNTVIDSYVPTPETLTTDFYRPTGWDTRPKTHTDYDNLIRPISATVPGISAPTTTSYGSTGGFSTVTVIDALGHKKAQTLDGLGRLKKVEEYSGTGTYTLYATTTYTYDALGDLLNVQPPAGPTTVMTYDGLKRKLTMNDPAMGNWSYQYDSAGNLIQQTDAKTQAICLAYDALSRLTSKTYGCGATATITYTYDSVASGNKGKGRRTGMTDPSGSSSWVYDYLGRVTSETHVINNVAGSNRTYTLGHSYDLLGRVTSTTYPDGEVVNQTYNAQSLPLTLASTTNGSYVTNALYNALGQMKQLALSNGVTSSYTYDPANRLASIGHQNASFNTLAYFAYTFDSVGNPVQVMEAGDQSLLPTTTSTPTATNTLAATNTPTATATRTPTFTSSPTATNTSVVTNTPTATATATASGGSTTITAQVASSSDDVNQDGTTLTSADPTVWLGNAASTTSSYTGLRFTNLNIPPGAAITSAHLEMYSGQSQWVSISFNIAAEATGSSPTFSTGNLPSQRTLTTQQVNHSSNVQWQANTWYSLNEMGAVIQEVVNRADWQSGNSLAIILKGTGSAWGRKFASSFDSSTVTAPKLVIVYAANGGTTSTATATATTTPTATATRTPTATNTSAAANTPTATATATRTPTATNTLAATNTPTATATNTPASGAFPATGVLDNFNRANGSIGGNWSGQTSGYAIASNQLDVTSAGYIFWNAASFGADQEAYVTLSNIDPTSGTEHDLLLKSQSSSSWSSGVIEVLYDSAGHKVQVWTYTSAQNWVQRGADIPVTFANGDVFGAKAKANGQVEVYRNGTLLGSRDVTAWPYYTNGGYIGLWFLGAANALLDNFGGGTASGGFHNNGNVVLASDSSSPRSREVADYALVPPSVPVLLSPANGAQLTTYTPTLDWTDSTPAYALDHYELQIATDSNFVNLLGRGCGGNVGGASEYTLYPLECPLPPNTTYYWRVRAVGPQVAWPGQTEYSAWSASRSFNSPIATSTPTPTATATPTAAVVINYNFDHLDRLTHTDYTGGSTIDYTYDVMGNRLTQNSNIGAIGNTSYGYGTNNRLTSINGSTIGLAYDNNGNMSSRKVNGVTWTQAYDFENRLTSAGNGTQTWSFTYDGDGNRVKQVAANGDVTAYVGGMYEVTYSSGGALKNTKLYYAFGSQVVAMRDNGTPYYLHGDNLGSASLTTSVTAAIVSQNRYYPFGAARSTTGTRPTDLDFTGQRLDGTGLHFYNTRYYDSLLGRFVSADTVVQDVTKSQTHNRYVYVANNPVRYTDPTGHCFGPLIVVCVDVFLAAMEVGPTALTLGGLILAVSQIPGDTAPHGQPGDPNVMLAGMDLMFTGQMLKAPIQQSQSLPAQPIELEDEQAIKGGLIAEQRLQQALGCSFSPDTLVATIQGEKAIGKLHIGDYVLAYDEVTGILGYYPIDAVLVNIDPVVETLVIDDEQIETTPEHPFFTREYGWLPAGKLWIGAHVRKSNGSYETVQTIEIKSQLQAMYNLTVAHAHTFFTGLGQWLVHNDCGRRGNPDTRAQLDDIRDEFLASNPDFKHIFGGRDAATGLPLPEEYLPGPQGGLKGSNWPDLTFEASTGYRVRFNTVDVNSRGKITGRELNAINQILQKTHEFIFAIPKRQ